MTTPLYVVAGQSNAERIDRYDSLIEYLSDNSIDAGYASLAVGATSLEPSEGGYDDWYPFEDGDPKTGELLDALIDTIADALAADPDTYLAGILWVQGEADAKFGRGAAYEVRLQALHDRLRSEFGDDFNFTISGLSENMTFYRGHEDQLRVTEAQERIARNNENVSIIDPDMAIAFARLLPSDGAEDRIHFSDAGADAVAAMFMDQFVNGAFVGLNGASRTFTDTDDVKDWLRYTDSNDLFGDLRIRQITYDDGVIETKYREFDVVFFQTYWDERDNANWLTIEQDVDAAGNISLRRAVLDDGKLVTTTFKDGVRSAVAKYDPNDTFGWSSIEKQVTGDSDSYSLITTYDDGRVATEQFENGVRRSVEFRDAQDDKRWDTVTKYYDENGVLTSKVKIWDDGRTRTQTFEENGKSAMTETDFADEFAWSSVVVTAQDGEDTFTHVTHYDDGRVATEVFEDGVRRSVEFADAVNDKAWDSVTKYYGADGALTSKVKIWDDGRERVLSFEDDLIIV